MLTLEPKDLRQLTGKARRGDQLEWLALNGVPYRLDGLRILVGRTAVDSWLGGKDVPQERGIDLSRVK